MFVYTTGEKSSQQPTFIMCVAPAADLADSEIPAEWLDDLKNPLQINVEFKFGRAEVPDNLGKYLVKRGFAARSKLIHKALGLVGV